MSSCASQVASLANPEVTAIYFAEQLGESVLIDYVFEYLMFEEDLYIEPGTQVQIEFFVDQNTLLLMDSEFKVGMEVTVFEFLAKRAK